MISGQVNGEDAFLVPTAELPVTNIHREEILEESDLPRRWACFTPCFRSEAGSAGRDVRGLIRQHQFHKVELVWLTTPERADQDYAALLGHAETCLQRLELPYRIVLPLRWRRRVLGRALPRPRGLAAEPGDVPRDLVVLALHRLPGPPDAAPLPARQRGREEGQAPPGAHAERLGPRGRAHARGDPRERPAARRLGRDPRGAAAVSRRSRSALAFAALTRVQ